VLFWGALRSEITNKVEWPYSTGLLDSHRDSRMRLNNGDAADTGLERRTAAAQPDLGL